MSGEQSPAPARPSASVVLIRDGAAGLEVLLVQRHQAIAFHGGAWVFPGGRVDAADGSEDNDELLARRAAVREVAEETGLQIEADDLVPFAHWTTPVELPKRFATWFFLIAVSDDQVVSVDGEEIVASRWEQPEQALKARVRGEIDLPAPTYVTLLGLGEFEHCAAALAAFEVADVVRFVPRLVKVPGARCTVYAEDAAYETLDADTPGARHRLVMGKQEWQYLRDF